MNPGYAKITLTAVICMVLAMLLAGYLPAQAAEQETTSGAVMETPDFPDYIIGPEDVLDISVWKNPDLSKTVMVRPDGNISLPLIGDIRAAGLTPEGLRNTIVSRLKQYQQTVVVSVMVNEINSYKVFIFGEVLRPGVYSLKRETTLVQAIALAGGFNQFASKNKIVLIRTPGHGSDKQKKMLIRFNEIIDYDEVSGPNLTLKPGDTIFVP